MWVRGSPPWWTMEGPGGEKEWAAWAMLLCWCHAAGRCRPFSDREVGTAAFSLSASHTQVTTGCSSSVCCPWFTAFIFAWFSRELATLHRQWCSLWSLVPPESTGRNWVNKSYNVLSLSLQLQGKTFPFQSHQSKRWERPLGLPCVPLRTECGVQS